MRLMIWNINRFSGHTLTRSNPFCVNHILTTFAAQALDIFVIVEVQSSQGLRGQLIEGWGKTGVLELLTLIRQNQGGGADWRLVPPLKLVASIVDQNYTEGIAVYYNNQTLDFVGPYYWDSAQGIAVANQTNTAYPNSWANCLPANNNRAGQLNFTDYQNNSTLEFPDVNKRRPFLTHFTERGGQQRTIRLVSAHMPPASGANDQNNSAYADTSRAAYYLAKSAQVRNPANNDVIIAAGDFNFNLVDLKPNDLYTQAFLQLVNVIGPALFLTTNSPTYIQDNDNATPLGMAPGYGYMKQSYLDNMFVGYGATAAPNPAYPANPTVVNRVLGTGVYGLDMSTSIPTMLGYVNYNNLQKTTLFQQIVNYGHISRYDGVSDHLAIVADL